MKKLYALFVCLFLCTGIFSQVPQKLIYQCVIKDANGAILKNTAVGIRIGLFRQYVSGDPLYQESFTPNPRTNEDGIVNLEIGSGKKAMGDISLIDPMCGPYLVRVDVDPAGGSNYSVISITDFMRLPDKKNAMETERAVAGDFSQLLPGGPVRILKTAVVSEGREVLTSAGRAPKPWKPFSKCQHFVGERYGGGIVFYIYDEGCHGLIAATEDFPPEKGLPWDSLYTKFAGATGNGIGAGYMNTSVIISVLMTNSPLNIFGETIDYRFAAKACADYKVTEGDVVYGDWYLPSFREMSYLFRNRLVVGGISDYYCYWTSSEMYQLDWSTAMTYDCSTCYCNGLVSKGKPLRVRAIRRF